LARPVDNGSTTQTYYTVNTVIITPHLRSVFSLFSCLLFRTILNLKTVALGLSQFLSQTLELKVPSNFNHCTHVNIAVTYSAFGVLVMGKSHVFIGNLEYYQRVTTSRPSINTHAV